MKNSQLLLEYLQEYSIDEEIYRRYYELAPDPAARAAYVAGLDSELIRSRNILIPDYPGVYFPTEIAEEYFDSNPPIFLDSSSSSVYLSKHYRYTPAIEHSHNYFEIIYMLSGSCRQTLDGEDLPLHAGDLCFIPPHCKHSLNVFDDSIAINLILRRKTFEHVFFNVLCLNSVLASFFMSHLYSKHPMKRIVFSTKDDPEIRDAVLEMYLESHSQDRYSAFLLENMVAVFFAKVLRGYSRSASVMQTKGHANNEKAMELLSYINQNYQNLNLRDLALHFHYSPEHCSRLIKEETGRNFTAILRSSRINRACDLLSSTRQSISSISEEVGYENPETFIRAFVKEMQLTPGKYRKKAQIPGADFTAPGTG